MSSQHRMSVRKLRPLSLDTSMSQAASRDRARSLRGGDKKGPRPQKATLVGGKKPCPHSKGGCKQGKWGGEKGAKKSNRQKKTGMVRGECLPAGRHSDPLPETEAAEEEEGERAKAASRCRDGRFFHMAATPRYGRPGPIPGRL